MDNKLPRRLELQPNLKQVSLGDGGQKVTYSGYTADFDGIVQSYIERWEGAFLADVYDEWIKDADQVRVPAATQNWFVRIKVTRPKIKIVSENTLSLKSNLVI